MSCPILRSVMSCRDHHQGRSDLGDEMSTRGIDMSQFHPEKALTRIWIR